MIDISTPLCDETACYPGDPKFILSTWCEANPRDTSSFRISWLHFGTHTGTHVDAPRHFDPNGPSVEQLDPGSLWGPARVLVFDQPTARVEVDWLKSQELKGIERVLIRTGNGEVTLPSSTYLSPEAAHFIVSETSIRLLGLDSMSVDPSDSTTFPAHRALLTGTRWVTLVEGLVLTSVVPGDYEIAVLPLLIVGADASPARAFLRAKSL